MNIMNNDTDPLSFSSSNISSPAGTRAILPTILCAIVVYPIITILLRHDRRRRTLQRYPYHDRSTFASMTDNDAQGIVRTLSQLEFPFTFEKSLQFALFKTYGIPSVSKLLVATSQLSDPATASKRYVDTELLVREWMSWSPHEERGQKALARMNYIHSGYLKSGKILEDDMLFTLASFVTEPVRWIAQYEWRPLKDFEICALAAFFKSAGESMGISYRKLKSGEKEDWKDGLQWYEEVLEWTEEYANEHMVPDINNKITADQTVAILVWNIPNLLRPFAINLVKALMDERLRKAMMWVLRSLLHPMIAPNLTSAPGTQPLPRSTSALYSISSPCVNLSSATCLHHDQSSSPWTPFPESPLQRAATTISNTTPHLSMSNPRYGNVSNQQHGSPGQWAFPYLAIKGISSFLGDIHLRKWGRES